MTRKMGSDGICIRAASVVDDYLEIVSVWESSVKTTHSFLKDEDFYFHKELLATQYLQAVDLYVLCEGTRVLGFLGVAGENLEMLFVEANSIGLGYGRKLLDFAVKELSVKRLDVNEENSRALAFYERAGFKVFGRSEKDAMGKDYPLLHLILE